MVVLLCQDLESLTYISAADSMAVYLQLFLNVKVQTLRVQKCCPKTHFDMK